MKKVGKWIISLIIIAIVAFIVYVVVMAYKTSQEWTVTIKFNDSIVKEIKVEDDETLQVSEILSQIEIEGYEPLALYDNAEFAGESLEGSIKINDDKTFYLACEKLLNLQLVYGDQVTNLYGKAGDTLTNPLNVEKENARFLGWADGDEIVLSDTKTYTFIEADFEDYIYILTAKFEEPFKVSFNSNGGTTFETQYLFSGENLTLPTCTKEHYVLTGWLVNGQSYKAGENYVVTKDTTAIAQWRAEQYRLIYQSESGQEIETATVSYNQVVSLSLQPTAQEGHYASGWMIDGELYTSTYTVPDIGNDGDNIVATSTYKVENYTIVFSGTYNESYHNTRVTYGALTTLPTPTRDGYLFTGWSYNGSLYSGRWQVGDLGGNNAVATFTATWQSDEITLTFDYGDGTVESGKIDSIKIHAGDIITSSTLPTPIYAEPYTFEGWYLDEDFANAVKYNSTNNLTKDTTLYARISQPTDITAFGSGSQADPYRIYNGEQLNILQAAGTTDCPVKTGEYIEFMNDIVMSEDFYTQPLRRTMNININGNGFSFTLHKPLANEFRGTFTNITLIYPSTINVYRDSGIALFASNYGTISNVTIATQDITLNMDFSVTSYYPSLLVQNNSNTISNCQSYANIVINGTENQVPCFAVFVGQNNGVITNCKNYGDITTSGDVDVGVFAYLNAAEISNCYSDGDIYAFSVGVIANRHSSSSADTLKIINCEIYGNISSYAENVIDSSSIFGELRRTTSTSQVLTIGISNCKYSTSNIHLITIYDSANSVTNYYTDLETIKSLLPNVDFDSIVKI